MRARPLSRPLSDKSTCSKGPAPPGWTSLPVQRGIAGGLARPVSENEGGGNDASARELGTGAAGPQRPLPGRVRMVGVSLGGKGKPLQTTAAAIVLKPNGCFLGRSRHAGYAG